MSEHSEQVALFSYLDYYITKYPELKWLHAVPNGGARNIVVASNLKREGTKAGIWDISFPLARGGYSGLYIEMKFGSNKLTRKQEEFGEFVRSNNFLTAVFYNWEDAGKFILEYIEGKYERNSST